MHFIPESKIFEQPSLLCGFHDRSQDRFHDRSQHRCFKEYITWIILSHWAFHSKQLNSGTVASLN